MRYVRRLSLFRSVLYIRRSVPTSQPFLNSSSSFLPAIPLKTLSNLFHSNSQSIIAHLLSYRWPAPIPILRQRNFAMSMRTTSRSHCRRTCAQHQNPADVTLLAPVRLKGISFGHGRRTLEAVPETGRTHRASISSQHLGFGR